MVVHFFFNPPATYLVKVFSGCFIDTTLHCMHFLIAHIIYTFMPNTPESERVLIVALFRCISSRQVVLCEAVFGSKALSGKSNHGLMAHTISFVAESTFFPSTFYWYIVGCIPPRIVLFYPEAKLLSHRVITHLLFFQFSAYLHSKR